LLDEVVEVLPPSVVQKEGLPGIAAQDHVVEGAGKVYARFPGHAAIITSNVQMSNLTLQGSPGWGNQKKLRPPFLSKTEGYGLEGLGLVPCRPRLVENPTRRTSQWRRPIERSSPAQKTFSYDGPGESYRQ